MKTVGFLKERFYLFFEVVKTAVLLILRRSETSGVTYSPKALSMVLTGPAEPLELVSLKTVAVTQQSNCRQIVSCEKIMRH